MRILHVVPTYLPARRYGGPIVAVHGLARSLAARGHDVDVMTTNVDGRGVSDVPLGEPVMMDGVRIRYFPSSFPRLYWSPAMGRALDRDARTYDVIHLHSVFLWPTLAASRAAARAGVPSVISPRGMLVPELIRAKSRGIKTAWLRLFERGNFARAAAIHFTSQREWDDARPIGLPLPAPFIIPNGTDERLNGIQEVARSPRTLLFLGRINWKKGLDRLIAAMSLIDDAQLIVAGNDEENYIATLQKHERVTFIGAVEGERKDELLRTATLLVLPSHSENFGNVVIEALAVGTPVVVTPGVGLADDVRTSGSGVVVSNEPAELARAINELLADDATREEMGRRGRALVEERFTWPRVAQQMEEAYCSIRSRR